MVSIVFMTLLILTVEMCFSQTMPLNYQGGEIQLKEYRISQQNDHDIFIYKSEKLYYKAKFEEKILKINTNPNYPFLAVFTSAAKDAQKDVPLEFLVSTLFIIDMEGKKISKCLSEDQLFFSDWYFNVWSPKGTYAAFLQTRWGPIHVVKIYNIMSYLQGKSSPYRIVTIKEKEDSPANIYGFGDWVSDNEFNFTAGCCGIIWTYLYQIEVNEYKEIKSESLREDERIWGREPPQERPRMRRPQRQEE